MIKRINHILIGFMILTGTATAQVRLGPIVGLNESRFAAAEKTVNMNSFSSLQQITAGAIVDISLSKKVSIESGARYSLNGSRFNFRTSGNQIFKNYKTELSYLEVPLSINANVLGKLRKRHSGRRHTRELPFLRFDSS